MALTLDQGIGLCRLLADPSRLRLQWVLETHELTVAELTHVTRLAQSRVSTHLARLRRAGLVRQRKSGGAAFYSAVPGDHPAAAMWALLRDQMDDSIARADLERAAQVVRARERAQTWAESVAGSMERQYSPGRTWEATARVLIDLVELGDVLDVACGDGVLVELLARRARSVTGVDISPRLISAAQRRLGEARNVKLLEADMHQLPLTDAAYDHVFLMHALAYTRKPQDVIREAARLLRPGGRLVIAALNAHRHKASVEAYDHVNLGMTPAALRTLLEGAQLRVESCQLSSREDRPPYFEVVSALARKS